MKGLNDTTTSHFGLLIGNGRKYIVPRFQRDYSWNIEQWDDLWQDIEKMFSEEDGDHYMGYLVLQTSDNKNYFIIDGQQRFTTITIIILAAIKSIKKLIDNGVDVQQNEKRKETLLSTYIGNVDPVSLTYDNLLVLNRNNNDYYESIVRLGELRLRGTSLTERLMKNCFEWYEKALEGKFKTGEEYALFIRNIVDNLYFTIINVNDEMNAFRVFETLNARGVQLSSSDLLKNYLFSLVDNAPNNKGRIEVLEGKWNKLTSNIKAEKLPDFVRYYWNSKNKTVRANELFKAIRENIKTDVEVFQIIDDMLVYSDVYMALKDHNDEYWGNNVEIRKNVELLNQYNLKQPYSLLMAAKRNLSESDFLKVFKDVIVISFRYSLICGKNPNDIERVYNEAAIIASYEKKYNRDLLKKIYVDNKEFVSIFENKSFSINSRSIKIIKDILGRIDRFSGGQKEVNLHSELDTIEHILPQHPSAEWGVSEEDAEKLSCRLGNLCLLEKSLNAQIGNGCYEDKVESLRKSGFVETQKIADEYRQWNNDTINSRQKHMAQCAQSIWRIDFL